MNSFGKLIASVAVAGLSIGAVSSGVIILGATEAAAKSSHASSKSKGQSKGRAGEEHGHSGHGKGLSRAQYARYLKNLNAMCSHSKSNSLHSNTKKIAEYYDRHEEASNADSDRSTAIAGIGALEGTTPADVVEYNAVPISSLSGDTLEAALTALVNEFDDDPNNDDSLLSLNGVDEGDLKALVDDYEAAQALLDAEHSALVAAVRGEDRATAFETAEPGTPLGDAFAYFNSGCPT